MEITNCDVQFYKDGYETFSLCFYGIRSCLLSSVLNSKAAIQINMSIMRAFVAIRQLIANPPVDRVGELEKQMLKLRAYMEEVFTDYNDINEDTLMQLKMINQTLAELQVRKKAEEKPRNPIGFRTYEY